MLNIDDSNSPNSQLSSQQTIDDQQITLSSGLQPASSDDRRRRRRQNRRPTAQNPSETGDAPLPKPVARGPAKPRGTSRLDKLQLYAQIFTNSAASAATAHNLSDDFSGGCTPYQRAAVKQRANAAAAAAAAAKGSRTRGAAARKTTATVGGRNRTRAPPRGGEVTDDGDDVVSRGPGQHEAEEGVSVPVEKSPRLSPSSPAKLDTPPSCDRNSSTDMQKNEERSIGGDDDSRPSAMTSCVACGEDFFASDGMQHLRQCLRDKYRRTTPNARRAVEAVVSRGQQEQDQVRCEICELDITSRSAYGRRCHLKQCTSQAKKQERQQMAALKLLQNKVLDCPICGQHLRTTASRQSHLKKCAAKYQLSTHVLMARVKEQQAASAGSSSVTEEPAMTSRAVPSRKRRTPAGRAAIRGLDEDTQLAIALSTSLKEELDRQEPLVAPSVGEGLTDAFLLLMSPGKRPKTGRRGGGKRGDRPPLMLLISKNELQQRREEKVAALVLPELVAPEVIADFLSPSEMTRKHSRVTGSCWTRSAQTLPASDLRYYVTALMPPVAPSALLAGSKLKRMSTIPGWQAVGDAEKSTIDVQPATPDGSGGRLDETLPVTQTALVLAQLAAAADRLTQIPTADLLTRIPAADPLTQIPVADHSTSSPAAGDTTAVATGFCVHPLTTVRTLTAQDRLLATFSALVNDPTFSDIGFKVKGDKVVHAHRVILAARCPRLIELLDDDDTTFARYDHQVVLGVLRFIYAAELVVPPSNVKDTRHLAAKLQLAELTAACEDVGVQVEPPGEGHAHYADVDLQTLLDAAWGSDGETSSDDDDEEQDAAAEAERYEEEMDALYAYTQRERRQGRGADDAAAGLSGDDAASAGVAVDAVGSSDDSVTAGDVAASSSDGDRPATETTPESDDDGESSRGSVSADRLLYLSGRRVSQCQSVSPCPSASPCPSVWHASPSASPDPPASPRPSASSQSDSPGADAPIISGERLRASRVATDPLDTSSDTLSGDRSPAESMRSSSPVFTQRRSQSSCHQPSSSRPRAGSPVVAVVSDEDAPIGVSASSSRHSEDAPIGVSPSSSYHWEDAPVGVSPSSSHHSEDAPIGVSPSSSRHWEDAPIGVSPSSSRHSEDAPIGVTPSSSRHWEDAPIGVSPSCSRHSEADDNVAAAARDDTTGVDLFESFSDDDVATARPRIRVGSAGKSRSGGDAEDTRGDESMSRSWLRRRMSQHSTPLPSVESTWWDDATARRPPNGGDLNYSGGGSVRNESRFDDGRRSDDKNLTKNTSCLGVSPCEDRSNEDIIFGDDRRREGEEEREGTRDVSRGRDDRDDEPLIDLTESYDVTKTEEIGDDNGIADQGSGADEPAGLWDDFDDLGYNAEDFSEQVPQQAAAEKGSDDPSPSSIPLKIGRQHADTDDLVAKSTDGEDYDDPPTFMEDESDLVVETVRKNAAKTPPESVTKARRAVAPPITPMANYSAMSTPQLKVAAGDIGVKMVAKKRMVKLLKHVYEETHVHQLENRPSSSTDTHKGAPPPVATVHKRAAVTKRPSKRRLSSESPERTASDGCPSQAGSAAEADARSDICLAETRSPAKGVSRKDLHYKQQQIRKYIMSKDELYIKILHYEPLNLDDLHQQLKVAGQNIGTAVLIDFLDEQNIVYTTRDRISKRHKSQKAKKKFKKDAVSAS